MTSAAPASGEHGAVAGHILARLLPGAQLLPASLGGGRILRPSAADLPALIEAADPSGEGTARLLGQLQRDPAVVWAEREQTRRPHRSRPSDPFFDAQWSLSLTHVAEAWDLARGSRDIVVAVVDTGILPHADLGDRLLPGYDFVTSTIDAGDGDGRDTDPTDPGTAAASSSGLHGLQMAGVIGAATDNGLGMAGVDWACRLLPVRALGVVSGVGADGDIADAIRWAAGLPVAGAPDNPWPAAVINLSFGGPGTSRALDDAVAAALAAGAVVVASAGNDAADVAGYAPAGIAGVVAVGAVDRAGAPADYSNHGPGLAVLAPGGRLTPGAGAGEILSLAWDAGGYAYASRVGTSVAAAHVSGTVALLLSIDGSLSSAQARALLGDTAAPIEGCRVDCGAGLLDAEAAVAALQRRCVNHPCSPPGRAAPSLHGGCSIAGAHLGAGTLALGLLLPALAARKRRRSRGSVEPPRWQSINGPSGGSAAHMGGDQRTCEAPPDDPFE